MRVFVTGASGYIGKGVARAFAQAGHRVTGLIRSEAAAKELQKLEISPHFGDIGNPSSYKKVVEAAEVLIHCAVERSPDAVQKDLLTIDTFIQAAAHTPKTLLYTSGCWVYGSADHILDEATPLHPLALVKWRPLHEQKILQSTSPNLRTVIIRPAHVYGYDKGLIAMLFETAAKGTTTIVGPGDNYWPLIHLDDLANLYLLAAEKELSNTILNACDCSVQVKEMAEATAKIAGHPGKIKMLPYPEALTLYGPLAEGLAVNQKLCNQRAARLLNWRPRHQDFLSNLESHWAAWKT